MSPTPNGGSSNFFAPYSDGFGTAALQCSDCTELSAVSAKEKDFSLRTD